MRLRFVGFCRAAIALRSDCRKSPLRQGTNVAPKCLTDDEAASTRTDAGYRTFAATLNLSWIHHFRTPIMMTRRTILLSSLLAAAATLVQNAPAARAYKILNQAVYAQIDGATLSLD